MADSHPTRLGDLIRRRRTELGLSRTELADRVGRTGSTVRRWERNEGMPSDTLIESLADALDVDPAELVTPPSARGENADAESPPRRGVQPPASSPEAVSAATRPAEPQSRPAAKPSTMSRPQVPAPQPDGRSGTPAVEPTTRQITEVPTEVMAVPTAPPQEPVADRQQPRRRSPPPEPRAAAPLSYVEDPTQRYRYVLRGILTGIAIAAMLVILVWAFGELTEALGDVWDLFQEEPSQDTAFGTEF